LPALTLINVKTDHRIVIWWLDYRHNDPVWETPDSGIEIKDALKAGISYSS